MSSRSIDYRAAIEPVTVTNLQGEEFTAEHGWWRAVYHEDIQYFKLSVSLHGTQTEGMEGPACFIAYGARAGEWPESPAGDPPAWFTQAVAAFAQEVAK